MKIRNICTFSVWDTKSTAEAMLITVHATLTLAYIQSLHLELYIAQILVTKFSIYIKKILNLHKIYSTMDRKK